MPAGTPAHPGGVVLVSGAREGIGRAIADGLETSGFVVGRVEDPGGSRADAERAFRDAAAGLDAAGAYVHAFVDRDALEPAAITETSEAEWARRGEEVLRTAVWCAQAAWTLLHERGGRIVFVTPTISMTGAAGLTPYATAVEGIRSLAKSAARQWGAAGITVGCVAPPVELMLEDTAARSEPTIGEPALGGMPDPRADLAPVVALLLSDDAHALTGTTLTVDGGVLMLP
jgi:3-oxoacyl-[acyl-carrier protein] reductase